MHACTYARAHIYTYIHIYMYVHLYHMAVLEKLIIEHFDVKIVHSKYFLLDILTNSSSG